MSRDFGPILDRNSIDNPRRYVVLKEKKKRKKKKGKYGKINSYK